MGPRILTIMAILFLLVLASGCTNAPKSAGNETTEYKYYNTSNATGNESGGNGNEMPKIASGDFTFKIYGVNEFWMKANDTTRFYVVFNNKEDDGEGHMLIARVFPSAADFDVMAAFQCLHFATCDSILSRMSIMIDQPENSTLVNYRHVNLYPIGIHVPDNTPSGTYMYNMVACKDIAFADCIEISSNFGANVPVIVHVL